MGITISRLVQKSTLLLGVGLLVVAMVLPLGKASATGVSFNSTRDCNANAVIFCGAMSVPELQQKYASDPSIGAIYNFFGITPTAISNIGNVAVAGQVTKSGQVIVAGKVVATNAVTEGRSNMPGSVERMAGGVVFFERTPSVSFLSNSLDAFVVMNGNKFAYAILASCGNAVVATPVVTPSPAPKPTPTPTPKPTPTPSSPTIVNNNVNNVQVNQTQSQTQTQTTPAPAQTTAAVTTPVTTLPSTGPGDIIGLFGVSMIVGSAAHYLLQRRKLAHASSAE